MIAHFGERADDKLTEVLDLVSPRTGEREVDLDAVVPLRAGCLVATAARRAVRTHILQVDRRSDDLDVLERELRALGDDAAVHDDHGATVVVEAVPIAPLLVCIEVYASELPSCTSAKS